MEEARVVDEQASKRAHVQGRSRSADEKGPPVAETNT